jgi:glycosyltransferase involved in cell wall biosynthesis
VRERVVLFGECARVEEAYSAFDIYCSSSVAEGFPNVVAEAMLSELPCVVTDTGAARELVDGIGYVVSPRDSEALAGALIAAVSAITTSANQNGTALRARKRIIDRYSLGQIVGRYEQVYGSLALNGASLEYIHPAAAQF